MGNGKPWAASPKSDFSRWARVDMGDGGFQVPAATPEESLRRARLMAASQIMANALQGVIDDCALGNSLTSNTEQFAKDALRYAKEG